MEPLDQRRKSLIDLPIPTATRYRYGADTLNFGDLYLPAIPGPYPLVLLVHGGFWRSAYDLTFMNGLANHLAYHGIAAWNIEYRRVGDIGGGWPATLQDVALAADYLRTIATLYVPDIDLHRIVSVGHSAGGQLALWLAARPHLPVHSVLSTNLPPLALTGVVSLAGAIDLVRVWRLNLSNSAAREFLGGSPAEVPERYALASPSLLLPLGIPQILAHGTNDDSVPFEISQNYARGAIAAGDKVTFIELQGADHFVVIDPLSEAWAMTLTEIQKLFVP